MLTGYVVARDSDIKIISSNLRNNKLDYLPWVIVFFFGSMRIVYFSFVEEKFKWNRILYWRARQKIGNYVWWDHQIKPLSMRAVWNRKQQRAKRFWTVQRACTVILILWTRRQTFRINKNVGKAEFIGVINLYLYDINFELENTGCEKKGGQKNVTDSGLFH